MRIEPTSDKAAEYIWLGQHCLNLNSTGNKAIQDGMFTVICKYTPEKAVLIVVGGGNFLTHPRSGKLKLQPYFDNQMNQYYLTGIDGGGWREDLSELANRYTYPLQDDDKGTWVVNAEDITCEWTVIENYGNCWWVGSDGTILSWKGPPNRHFYIDSTINIPGLSRQREVVSTGDTNTEFYTYFDYNVYQDGEVLCTAPYLVAGAFYMEDTLIVLCVANLRPNGFWLVPFKTDLTVFTELGGKFALSNPLLIPAFISKDASSFVFERVTYKVNDDTTAIELVDPATASTGTQNEPPRSNIEQSYWYDGTFKKSGIRQLWVEPANDITANYTINDKTTTINKAAEKTVSVPIYRVVPDITLTINGPNTASVGFCYTPSYTVCSGSWSFSGGTIDNNGCITSVSCVSGASAVATVEYTLGDQTASLRVLLPNAVWALVSSYAVPGSCTPGVDYSIASRILDSTTECNYGAFPSLYSPPATPNEYYSCEIINYVAYRFPGGSGCASGSPPCNNPSDPTTTPPRQYIITGDDVYEKRCP